MSSKKAKIEIKVYKIRTRFFFEIMRLKSKLRDRKS